MFNFFRRKDPTVQITSDSPLANKYYVYINGVAYMRCGHLIACCDYKLPPAEQTWAVIHSPEDHPEVTRVAYALALIEGLIEMRAVSPTTGNSLN